LTSKLRGITVERGFRNVVASGWNSERIGSVNRPMVSATAAEE
jgi:hypothetical protein